MKSQANVSVCIIVKNEPLLEDCIKSIRDYVKEIVIVDTGSTDGTADVARRLADVFENYTACNNPETGLIEDFSQARQRSFELATQPWVMWMDADDVIVGAENLLKLTDAINPDVDAIAFMFPYEYSYNELGQCTCLHYRERLFSNKNKFHWVNPVHEVVIPNDGVNCAFVTDDSVVYKHRRQYSNKAPESGRNLRILRNYFAKVGDSDARQMYYLGLECYNNGLVDEAIQHLSKYVDISGWDDERAMACLKLVDIFQAQGKYEDGLKWAFKTISIKETWGEGYFALAKMFYFLAERGGPNEMRHWERCVYFSRVGLNLPVTKTLLFVNPLDREYDIHRYLNMALSKLGDIKGALESVNIGLKSQPNDQALIINKKIYEIWIHKQEALAAIYQLRALEELTPKMSDFIGAVLNKQTINENKFLLNWEIPAKCNFEELPAHLSDDQVNSTIVLLWKQLILRDEFASAAALVASLPITMQNSDDIIRISNISKDLEKQKLNSITTTSSALVRTDKPLNVIFFAGDGVETWTPETVKRMGIGGSETMLLEQAKRLAALGHNVSVYNSCGIFGSKVYDGVHYYQTNKFKDLECDVLVVSRRADMLDDKYNIKAKLKLLWVHDVYAIAATNELLLKADRVLALTEWHKQVLVNIHNIHPDHVIVTRNGIDLNLFTKNIKRNQFKCVNSSSPDRSWPILLEVWPQIKKQVPKAELHLYYGFKNWEFSAQHDKLQSDLIGRLKNQIKELEPLGVVYHDRVSKEVLAEEFLSAGCWIHPTWFTETSCITAMEAQAAGLGVVTSSIAALNETVSNRGILINGDWTSIEYKDKFVKSVIKSINNYSESDRINLQQYAKQTFGLDDLAQDWSNMFNQLIDEVNVHPMTPYQPTVPYKENGNGYYNGDTRLLESNPERRKTQ
jgi:glycosyltransferase involved in cell wall biosynthesis